MKLRSQGMTAAIAAMLLLLALPVQAQDGGSRVTFDGVGFAFDATLGTSVNITQVRGQSPDLEGIEMPDAQHLVFTLYGRRAEFVKVPRVADAPGVVRVYRMPDLARYDLASKRVAQLRALLADRPDLAKFTEVNADGFGDELPLLPVFSAGQALRARVQYVDTPQVSGIAYVTAFRQDFYPFTADEFWYTFQGFSTDGTRYVSVTWILDAGDMFPDRIRLKDANRILGRIERWVRYLTASTATLDAASPSAFTPPLTSLDALVRSITFDTVPASTPTPSGSPAPSPVASAAG